MINVMAGVVIGAFVGTVVFLISPAARLGIEEAIVEAEYP